MLVTGSGAPTCAMVYKLTERENSAGEMQPVAKKSKDKATVPGRKLAFRSYEYSLADCEHVISGSEDKLAAYQPEDGWKDLLVDYVTNGENHSEYQGHDAIVNAHNYRAQALAELPIGAQSLMKGESPCFYFRHCFILPVRSKRNNKNRRPVIHRASVFA